ncbi:MAG: metal ABC transporter ATP-binding protein [Chlamydia sp.]
MTQKFEPQKTSTTAIAIEEVSFGYSPSEILLKNVSLSIQEGQFLGIIGPNGGGKSTFLKLILGALKPNHGSIQFFGSSTYNPGLLGYVPQSLQIDKQFPITTIEVVLGGRARYINRWGHYSKKDIGIAEKTLSQVGLEGTEDQPFGTLSGGQMQRALIARALASEPKILLLDEPTASIDYNAEGEILQVIHSLVGTMTILMVTHDLQTTLTKVDGIVCIQGGALFMQPKEVCEHFALGLYHFPLIQTEPYHLSARTKRASKRLPVISNSPL